METPPEHAMLMKSLTVFRDSVSFHLMDEPPLPEVIATPLRRALGTVGEVIDKLRADCNCQESGLTVYAPPSSENG
jgi:hypothetical protein